MQRTYLVKYKNQEGSTGYKLVNEEAVSSEGNPTFEIEGISLFDILYIQPYSCYN